MVGSDTFSQLKPKMHPGSLILWHMSGFLILLLRQGGLNYIEKVNVKSTTSQSLWRSGAGHGGCWQQTEPA